MTISSVVHRKPVTRSQSRKNFSSFEYATVFQESIKALRKRNNSTIAKLQHEIKQGAVSLNEKQQEVDTVYKELEENETQHILRVRAIVNDRNFHRDQRKGIKKAFDASKREARRLLDNLRDARNEAHASIVQASAARDEVDNLKEQLERLKQRNDVLEHSMQRKRDQLAERVGQLTEAHDQLSQANAKVDDLTNTLHVTESTVGDLNQRIQQLQQSNEAFQFQMQEYQQIAENRESHLKDYAATLTCERNSLRVDNATLKDALDSMTRKANHNKILAKQLQRQLQTNPK